LGTRPSWLTETLKTDYFAVNECFQYTNCFHEQCFALQNGLIDSILLISQILFCLQNNSYNFRIRGFLNDHMTGVSAGHGGWPLVNTLVQSTCSKDANETESGGFVHCKMTIIC